MSGYPNLELLEYKAWNAVRLKRSAQESIIINRQCKADMFLQMWSDALGGRRSNPSQMTSQTVTEEYTTVLTLRWIEQTEYDKLIRRMGTEYMVCVVCFGNDIGYVVDPPNKIFFDDLVDRNIASVMDSGKYITKTI